MGVVYRAYNTQLGRDVALKLLPLSGLDNDAEYVARFRRESAIAARLSDPHIVPIHDFGEIDGRLFIDMRLVEGADLAAVLRNEGFLPPTRAVKIASQVASALDAAHRDGLVHRDVKPSNVLISGGGKDFVYLTDFGVATDRLTEATLTRTGEIIGSLGYMAPEVLRGTSYNHQVDVYSLACLLYASLTGCQPSPDGSILEILDWHLHGSPPRPSQKQSGVPPALDEVIARGMARDPTDRYSSAGQLAAAALAAVDDRAALATVADRPTFWGRIRLLPRTGHPSNDRHEHDAATFRASNLPDTYHVDRFPAQDVTTPGLQVPPPFEPPPGPPNGSSGDGFRPLPPLRLRLRPDFRYVQGPLTDDDPIPFLDNQSAVDMLRHRIQYSSDGVLLVTGFPGVGKTTIVNRALDELEAALVPTPREPKPLVVVRLDVARPITPDELMVKLIRNLYEALQKAKVLERLADPIQNALKLAYQRTAQTLKEMRSESSERTNSLATGLPGLPPPTFKLGRKRSEGMQQEEAYLSYTLADAEHDFSQIVRELGRGSPTSASLLGRIGYRRQSKRPGPWVGRLVIVIDELDKLTAEPSGKACLGGIINALKNVFTASDVNFVFVAGTDVLDLARAARGHGNSVYGVFDMKPYIRCLSTGAARTLMSALVTEAEPAAHLNSLCDYLEYHSRGLPRHLLTHGLYGFVQWLGDQPFVVVTERDAPTVAFFAGLQRKLASLATHLSPQGPLSHPIDVDRLRMAVYLMTDWVLSRGNTTFSAADFSRDDAASRPDPHIVSDEFARELLEALASNQVGILERLEFDRSDSTMVDFPQSSEPVFRLASDVLTAAEASGGVPADLGKVGNGRYVLLEEIGRGALGRIYRAFDERQQDTVAIKLLDIPELVTDRHARQRFLRAAELARGLSHPGLVRLRGVLTEPDGVLGIVMDFVDGPSLVQVLKWGPLRPATVVVIAREILALLSYLVEHGVVRLDLKPSNIVLLDGLRPVVTELGLARPQKESGLDQITDVGAVLGTPRYAAPEQLRGEGVDIRADLYSLGLVLYEAIAGVPARSGNREIRQTAESERIELGGLACSQELRAVVACLLEFDREHRFDDPQAASAALFRTPEADEVT